MTRPGAGLTPASGRRRSWRWWFIGRRPLIVAGLLVGSGVVASLSGLATWASSPSDVRSALGPVVIAGTVALFVAALRIYWLETAARAAASVAAPDRTPQPDPVAYEITDHLTQVQGRQQWRQFARRRRVAAAGLFAFAPVGGALMALLPFVVVIADPPTLVPLRWVQVGTPVLAALVGLGTLGVMLYGAWRVLRRPITIVAGIVTEVDGGESLADAREPVVDLSAVKDWAIGLFLRMIGHDPAQVRLNNAREWLLHFDGSLTENPQPDDRPLAASRRVARRVRKGDFAVLFRDGDGRVFARVTHLEAGSDDVSGQP